MEVSLRLYVPHVMTTSRLMLKIRLPEASKGRPHIALIAMAKWIILLPTIRAFFHQRIAPGVTW
jgi:hypothetical protein